ncbi:MAG: hypothetical protein ACRDOL_17080, partial [Streptosporangiaceae bacterium]
PGACGPGACGPGAWGRGADGPGNCGPGQCGLGGAVRSVMVPYASFVVAYPQRTAVIADRRPT